MIRLVAMVVALTSGTVYTGDGPPLENATVLIQGNRILAVGRDVAIPEGAEVVDVSGSTVTPGLIDPASRLGVANIDLITGTVESTTLKKDPVSAALRLEER